MRFKAYQATPQAVAQGRAVGLYGATAKRLSRMARRSAQFTGDQGNRRFLDFVLTVVDDRVEWVERMQPQAA